MNKFSQTSKVLLAISTIFLFTLTACDDASETVSQKEAPKQQEPVQNTQQKSEEKSKIEQTKSQVKEIVQKSKPVSTDVSMKSSVSGYEERIIGNPDAPVTLVEYASYTCPHCADFHTKVLPQIKKDFVDTGKVKVIFRDFPFERVGATAALLSRCVPASRFAGFNDLLMKQQSNWAQSENPLGGLFKLAKLAGLSQDKIDSCLADEKLFDKIVAVRKEAMDKHGFNSTPSFLINGEKVIGSGEYEKFKNIIESKL